MLEFLPENIKYALEHLNLQQLYEIRLRVGKPISVNYRGEYRFLGAYGVTEQAETALLCDFSDVEECVYKAGKYSLYSIEEQIKKGFITADNGERIGLAGEYVFEKGQPLSIRNFTSLCIRVPHEVIGCGSEIYQACMFNGVHNLLIMSPPGLGKTTILRDLTRIISEKTRKNILICDERGELSAGMLGDTCDVVKFSDKATAFDAGIRAMRPDILITDELSLEDCHAIERAERAGIKVLASVHSASMEDLRKEYLTLFEFFIVLDTQKIGVIKEIYDKAGKVKYVG